MKYRVFPADAKGKLLQGFCPTLCDTMEKAWEVSDDLAKMLKRYGYKYEQIKIIEV